MMDEAAAFKPALFTQFKLAVVAPLSGSDFENWADSSPFHHHEHRGALRGTAESTYPQPELNATGLPSSAPGRPKLIELLASAPSPTPTRAEEHIASAPSPAAARRSELRTSPSCRPHLHDSSFPSFAALLRHPRVRVPAHFQTLQGG